MKYKLVTVRPNLNKKGMHTLHRGKRCGPVVCYRDKSLILFHSFYINVKALEKVKAGIKHKHPFAGVTGMPLPNGFKHFRPIGLVPITLNFKTCSFECDEPLTLGDLIYCEGHTFWKVSNFETI